MIACIPRRICDDFFERLLHVALVYCFYSSAAPYNFFHDAILDRSCSDKFYEGDLEVGKKWRANEGKRIELTDLTCLFSYVGLSDGLAVLYPGTPINNSLYDPRIR